MKASTNMEFVEIARKLMNDRDFYDSGLEISLHLLEQFDEDKIRAKLIGIYTELYRNSTSG
jgi:hypothetical protein